MASDPREAVRLYEQEWPDYGDAKGLAAPRAFAALRAVLDVHKPETLDADPHVEPRTICADCCPYDNEWPCPTVQAITTALEGTA